MRRIMGIAAILTGVASVSAAETSYKACAIDGRLEFYSFRHEGGEMITQHLGAGIEPRKRPFFAPQLFEVNNSVLFFLGDNAAIYFEDETQMELECFNISDSSMMAIAADASVSLVEMVEKEKARLDSISWPESVRSRLDQLEILLAEAYARDAKTRLEMALLQNELTQANAELEIALKTIEKADEWIESLEAQLATSD